MKARKIIAFIFLCIILTSECANSENIKSDNIQKEIIEGNPQAFVKIPIWGVYVIENDDKEIEIYKVIKGSPANNADVRYGDIIVSVDDLPVKERYSLFKLVYERKAPDDAIEVVLKRKGVRLKKSITPNSGYMMKDAYVFMREIVRTKEPLYLAIVVGYLNNIYLQGEALDQWKAYNKNYLVSMYENYYLSFFAPEKNFVLVERERIDKVLNELKLQYSGLVDIGLQQELGKMIGASHLLIIDYSRVFKPNAEILDIEIHKLIEVSSGKILASVPFNIKVAVQNKTAPNDLFSGGYHYLESGKYQEAIKTFTKVMEINPDDTDALGNRGLAYSRLGNHEQAIKDFTRLVELKPKDAKAYYARALAYSEVGSHYLALNDFRTAARLGYKDAQDILLKLGERW